jgi:hypothetical protein
MDENVFIKREGKYKFMAAPNGKVYSPPVDILPKHYIIFGTEKIIV